jgi:hypothetical protein
MTRICSICKQVKNLEKDFYKGRGYRGGYRSHCKKCARSFKTQTPEQTLLRVYRTRRRNRQFIWDYYSTHPCVDCGEPDPRVLELDHCRGDDKVAGVSQLVHNTRSLKTIVAEIAKCDVVCANCHRIRTCETQGWYSDIAGGR